MGKILKWIGIIVGGLVALIVLAVVGVATFVYLQTVPAREAGTR